MESCSDDALWVKPREWMEKVITDMGTVSQFTLLASTKKGSKPDFHGALGSGEAKRLYDYFYKKVQEGYRADRVKDGVFQAMMEVALVNDGPVSVPIILLPQIQASNSATLPNHR